MADIAAAILAKLKNKAAQKGMQKKWIAFQKKLGSETEDFATVLHTIHHFLAEPFSAVMKATDFSKQWVADANNWQSDAVLT